MPDEVVRGRLAMCKGDRTGARGTGVGDGPEDASSQISSLVVLVSKDYQRSGARLN